MPNLDIQQLNELYTKAETADKEIFTEMRSNCLLIAGKHYHKATNQLLHKFREIKSDENQRLRLVKNHVYRITRAYVNELLRHAPGVQPVPFSENELQDSKAAELSNSVWQSAKYKHNLRAKVRTWASNLIDLGECAVKVIFDPMKGKLVGYEQEVDEEGNPLFLDENNQPTIQKEIVDPFTGMVVGENQPMPSKRAVFSGDFVFETVLPFNLLRDPQAETMEESPYVIIRKMVDIEKAKKLAGDDEEKLNAITESAETTFKVFDGTRGEFIDSKGQVMLREYFWRPSHEYPNGWYVLAHENGILAEMELPFGIWPFAWCGFEEIPTSPRAHSIIRVLRPYQGEINRAASSIATAQITLGDDKLIVQAGSKVTQGSAIPGVRVISVSGQPPTVMSGRSGEQYFAYLQAQISEMYQVANLEEIQEEINGQMDANVLLFRSMRQKQRFSLYAEKFEQFLKEVCQIYLKLAQKYMSDDEMIRCVGRREWINIPEFKQVSELDYAIKLEPIGEDVSSMLGKSLQIQQVLQYVGKDLPAESRGKIISAMPFLNKEDMFSELTMDSANADSDILSLDRGQYVPARKGENHDYVLKRLYSRQKMRDYDLLSPEIQQMYEQKIQEHLQMKSEELAEIKRMQAEFIPQDGPLVGVDVFESVPNSTGGMKTVRARLPQQAVNWLMEQLKSQGAQLDQMKELPQAAMSDLATTTMNTIQQQGAPMQMDAGQQAPFNQGGF